MLDIDAPRSIQARRRSGAFHHEGNFRGIPYTVTTTKRGVQRGTKATITVQRWPFHQGMPPIVREIVRSGTIRELIFEADSVAKSIAVTVLKVAIRVTKARHVAHPRGPTKVVVQDGIARHVPAPPAPEDDGWSVWLSAVLAVLLALFMAWALWG